MTLQDAIARIQLMIDCATEPCGLGYIISSADEKPLRLALMSMVILREEQACPEPLVVYESV